MPKVLGYTPAWLSRPSSGFDFFQPTASVQEQSDVKEECYEGPVRTIARRGTEIFAAVGKHIRWSDLVLLKETWESQERSQPRPKSKRQTTRGEDEDNPRDGERSQARYRVLKVPVARKIRQLVISPLGDWLAILTSHTVHVATLPDPAHLTAPDTGPIRLKTFHLGPTAHVVESSPVASALWHPLGVSGSCLVTVTKDAVVRMWELSRENRWSFDNPTVAVDLKKLANASSNGEDLAPPRYGANKGFSPDLFEMDVAAACFGGTGDADEQGWAAMTLWAAMTEGDVYALCPLLPTKFQISSRSVASLSGHIAIRAALVNNDADCTNEDRQRCDQQRQWIANLQDQDPIVVERDLDQMEIHSRPSKPSSIPKLQGPFVLDPEHEEDDEITDILVVGPRASDESNIDDEDDASAMENDRSSLGVVFRLSSNGSVSVCLDVEGVEARWLPPKTPRRLATIDERLPSLLVFDRSWVLRDHQTRVRSWPTFTQDLNSRYATFVTTTANISFLSFQHRIKALESELQTGDEKGTAFRIDVLLDGPKTQVEQILDLASDDTSREHPPSCLVLDDSDLGFFLLAVSSEQPCAAILDNSSPGDSLDDERYYAPEPPNAPLVSDTRPPYQPPNTFWNILSFPTFMETRIHPRHRRAMREEIRFSPATLEVLTEAHRLLSQETHALGIAVSDLFRRCERLGYEFREQIKSAGQLASRIEGLTNVESDYEADEDDQQDQSWGQQRAVNRRIKRATARHEELSCRQEALRGKIARLGGKEMSDKEAALLKELETMAENVSSSSKQKDDEAAAAAADISDEEDIPITKPSSQLTLRQRFEEADRLKENLIAQVKELSGNGQTRNSDGNEEEEDDDDDWARRSTSSVKIPSELRRAKVAQIMALLERETALVDATRDRLERLSLEI